MRVKNPSFRLFLAALSVLSIAGAGACATVSAAPDAAPRWLSENIELIRTGVETTVFIESDPAGDDVRRRGGIGTIIGGGHILAPAHVVAGAGSVTVRTRRFLLDPPRVVPDEEAEADVVAVDVSKDAALLKTRRPIAAPEAALGRGYALTAGETAWYFGKVNACRFGLVGSPRATAGAMEDAIQMLVQAADGDSGAPLVVPGVGVIGMLHATSPDGERTYFVPIDAALDAVGWKR